jgi:sulfite oxidase
MTQGHKSWAWKRWEWVVPRSQAGKAFVVKAVDESYNSQPESYKAQYNFRGNLTNAWHKIEFLDPEETSGQQVTKGDAS